MQLHDRRPTVAVPDLNGRYERLRLALEFAPPAEHFLVLLGDLIDHGPESARILRLVRRIHEKYGLQVLAGNHEELMMNALFGPPGQRHPADAHPRSTPEWKRWLSNGGQATLDSYPSAALLIEDAQWLRQHAKRWFIRERWLYSHATRPHVSQRPISEEQLKASGLDLLLWDRPSGGANLYELRPDLLGSVHGHTPQRVPERLVGPDRKPAWLLDLGKHSPDIAVHHSALGVKFLRGTPPTAAAPPGPTSGQSVGGTLLGLFRPRRAPG